MECIVVAVDILDYFSDQQVVGVLIIIFLIIALALMTILGQLLYRWLYSMPRQVSRGINSRQLKLNYQPIVNIGDGQIAGCEVLCRWQTSDGVPVRPDLFIPVVEQNNQTRELSAQVVTTCIRELRQAGLIGRCKVAINAFPDDIASGHILELLCRLLPVKYYPLFTVDHLKIDKSFIWGAEKPSLKRRLVEHIVSIAKSLRLQVVAEGGETQDQLNFLRRIKVDYTQGYLHSRPLELREFAALLDAADPHLASRRPSLHTVTTEDEEHNEQAATADTH